MMIRPQPVMKNPEKKNLRVKSEKLAQGAHVSRKTRDRFNVCFDIYFLVNYFLLMFFSNDLSLSQEK